MILVSGYGSFWMSLLWISNRFRGLFEEISRGYFYRGNEHCRFCRWNELDNLSLGIIFPCKAASLRACEATRLRKSRVNCEYHLFTKLAQPPQKKTTHRLSILVY